MECPYVSRGGLKLRHALDVFGIDPNGWTCADLGCSTGGFVDCMLQAGAARVYAVDTAYGQLAWTLRNDPRVVVMERSNALHTNPPPPLPGSDPLRLVSVDLSWTRQSLAIPAALRWLGQENDSHAKGVVISLIKPHYEISKPELARLGTRGVLPEDVAQRVTDEVCAQLPSLGVRVLGLTKSPIAGGGGGKKGKGTGNAEWLVAVEPV